MELGKNYKRISSSPSHYTHSRTTHRARPKKSLPTFSERINSRADHKASEKKGKEQPLCFPPNRPRKTKKKSPEARGRRREAKVGWRDAAPGEKRIKLSQESGIVPALSPPGLLRRDRGEKRTRNLLSKPRGIIDEAGEKGGSVFALSPGGPKYKCDSAPRLPQCRGALAGPATAAAGAPILNTVTEDSKFDIA